MKGNTIFLRVKGKENPYAQVANALIRDSRLAWDTRGLLIFLLSLPDDWAIRMHHIEASGPAKKTARRRMLAEAVQYGYMHRARTTGGRHGTFKWVKLVFEDPAENPYYDGPPSAGFPSMDNLPICKDRLV